MFMTTLKTDSLTSFQNPRIQQLRNLLSQKEARSAAGVFITEGVRLGEEVLNSGVTPKTVFFSANVSSRGMVLVEHFRELGVEVLGLDPVLMNRVSETETSQGLLLVVPQNLIPLPQVPSLVLVLDQLRDPGNAGTILRSAAAAGVEAVFTTPGTVDVYSPKVVRSAMGAHFHLCISNQNWSDINAYFQKDPQHRIAVLLADSSADCTMWETNLRDPLALVIGGEADGASQEGITSADARIHIPMPGNFESLNAGVAASVLLFEVLRQRSV